jgi:polyphosphate kinase
MLRQEMDLGENDVYEVEGLLCLSDLFALTGLPLPELKDPVWRSALPPRLRRAY